MSVYTTTVIDSLIQCLQTYIIPIGGVGIFIASIIEEVIAPIPSAFVILTGGFLFLTHHAGLNLLSALVFKIAIPAAFGITLGSLFIYWLTYRFGKPFIERYGKWLGITWEDVEKTERWFQRGVRDDVFIFILRSLPFIPSVAISSFAGITRLNLKTYIISSILGTTIRASILAVLGWQIGNLYYKYADLISRFENDVLIVLLLILIAFIVYKKIKK